MDFIDLDFEDFEKPWDIPTPQVKFKQKRFKWTDRFGGVHKLKDIDDYYLQNIINFLRRSIYNRYFQDMIKFLEAEQINRINKKINCLVRGGRRGRREDQTENIRVVVHLS